MSDVIPTEQIERHILLLRGQKVILGVELARIYGVPTKRLNEQVKRNRERFPEDFMFQLTKDEHRSLISQCATSSSQSAGKSGETGDSSHFAMSSSRRPGHKDCANRSQFAKSEKVVE